MLLPRLPLLLFPRYYYCRAPVEARFSPCFLKCSQLCSLHLMQDLARALLTDPAFRRRGAAVFFLFGVGCTAVASIVTHVPF
jgi:hypothetical protein